MNFINGNCSCNSVQFQVDLDTLKAIVNCHCNLCRGMNGSAFSTYAAFLDDGFTIHQGNDKLKFYQATTNAQKCFCSNCGTPIYNINPKKYAGLKILYYGTIQNLMNHIPKANTYCESKLKWVHNSIIESTSQRVYLSNSVVKN